ncbi:MAG: M42 family metallopeptidase [Defluviitaleaceae bacterium]|nr:M42 family metallopeptidase [Defluviitaleaceae bacterium]
MDEKLAFLKELTDANGIAGCEKEVRHVFKKYVADHADEVTQDKLGSVIAKKVGIADGPKIAIAGHLDEVGFIVHYIDENGFIKFKPVGGWWSQVLLSQQMTITTHAGKRIHGIIGSTPPHILTAEQRKKVTELDDLFIDIGVADKKEAEAAGIRPGDMITPYLEFRELENSKYLLAKAWDNRFGCALAIDVLNQLKGENHPNTYFGVATVQEEVGCRGATTVANMINPDVVIAADVVLDGSIPGADKIKAKMGQGPCIILMDGGTVGHRALREYVMQLADELEIPYQLDVLMGGATDAATMHRAHDGAPAMSLGIPSRYIHSNGSIIHRDDYEHAVQLMTEFVKRFDKKALAHLLYAD